VIIWVVTVIVIYFVFKLYGRYHLFPGLK
jgi:hypothetical protein